MTTTSSTSTVLDFAEGDRPTLPSGLNVLTILTFIWCGISYISSIWSYMNADKALKNLQDSQDKIAEAPAWAKK